MNRAPDYAEAVVGWRAWHVVQAAGSLRLHSIARPIVWPARRELVASCLRHRSLLPWRRPAEHRPPDGPCTCGVWAMRSALAALDALDPYGRWGWRPVHRVLGEVSLWGQVVECDDGWRAECAYPRRIFVPIRRLHGGPVPELGRVLSALAAYGVPVERLAAGSRIELERELAGPLAPA